MCKERFFNLWTSFLTWYERMINIYMRDRLCVVHLLLLCDDCNTLSQTELWKNRKKIIRIYIYSVRSTLKHRSIYISANKTRLCEWKKMKCVRVMNGSRDDGCENCSMVHISIVHTDTYNERTHSCCSRTYNHRRKASSHNM